MIEIIGKIENPVILGGVFYYNRRILLMAVKLLEKKVSRKYKDVQQA